MGSQTRRALLTASMGAVAAGLALPARAHRLNEAISVLELRRTSPTADLTHQLYAHDLEHAFGLTGVALDWFASREGQARTRAYCQAMFEVADGAGQAVGFRYVGLELSGDAVLVYFDAPAERLRPAAAAAGPFSLMVWSRLLQDVSPSQRNLVNVRVDGRTASVSFRAGDGPARVDFS
jgi:hypothetical protein